MPIYGYFPYFDIRLYTINHAIYIIFKTTFNLLMHLKIEDYYIITGILDVNTSTVG